MNQSIQSRIFYRVRYQAPEKGNPERQMDFFSLPAAKHLLKGNPDYMHGRKASLLHIKQGEGVYLEEKWEGGVMIRRETELF